MEQGRAPGRPARFDLRDDTRTGVRGELVCGQDVEIDVNCVFTGPWNWAGREHWRELLHCQRAHSRRAPSSTLHPHRRRKDRSHRGRGRLIGPFARLRPGAQLPRGAHRQLCGSEEQHAGRRRQANHLAYLGDATVGERVNYGAGSITANYDGANKHRTVIEADVHIGSNCVLVARHHRRWRHGGWRQHHHQEHRAGR